MIDKQVIEESVKAMLDGIGEDRTREGLVETPRRIAKMYEEIFAGLDKDAGKYLTKTFHTNGSDLVVEKDIVFYSMCEHHFMPFFGKAHIGYVPDGQVVGLSKLARTVEVYARRPQIQEQMTAQIADAIMQYLAPRGAMVMLEAEHMCMTMRGVKKPGSQTVSIAKRGVFTTDEKLVQSFFAMVR